jgi:hypothetical protein
MTVARASQRRVLDAGSLVDDHTTAPGIPFLCEVTLADFMELPRVQHRAVWISQRVMGSIVRAFGAPT